MTAGTTFEEDTLGFVELGFRHFGRQRIDVLVHLQVSHWRTSRCLVVAHRAIPVCGRCLGKGKLDKRRQKRQCCQATAFEFS